MFNPHAEPIESRPVYKRIGIGNDAPRYVEPKPGSGAEICDEANRIWALVRGAAEGSNIRSARQISEEAIEIIDAALERIECEDGA